MIHTNWHDKDQQILIWRYKGKWSITEYKQAVEDTRSYLKETYKRVDVIEDFTDSHIVPHGYLYAALKTHEYVEAENLGIVTIVSPTIRTQAIVRIVNSLRYSEDKLHTTNSLAQAEKLISESRIRVAS